MTEIINEILIGCLVAQLFWSRTTDPMVFGSSHDHIFTQSRQLSVIPGVESRGAVTPRGRTRTAQSAKLFSVLKIPSEA